MFVVIVEFVIKAETRDLFLALVAENAQSSVELETGCRQFDVCIDPNDPTFVFLYEVYENLEAFEIHKTTDHFKIFDKNSSELVMEKNVKNLWLQGSAVQTME